MTVSVTFMAVILSERVATRYDRAIRPDLADWLQGMANEAKGR